jgi:predicted RNA polymerase sigma factor
MLYLISLLEQIAPNPMVTVNRTVAVAMVHGPARHATSLPERRYLTARARQLASDQHA